MVDEERFAPVARNQMQEKGERKRNETSQATWRVGARKDSFWLCCTGPLVGKQKSGISGSRPRPIPTAWEKNSWKS